MIASLLLTLSLIGQYGTYGKPFLPIPQEVKNLAFTHSQEEWVYQTRKNAIYDWYRVLPQEDADLMVMLDAEKVAFRRHARLHLKELGPKAIRILVWGSHAKSGEIRMVCESYLPPLYKCTYCNGTGKVEEKTYTGNATYMANCQGCKSSGSFFWYMRYNYQEGDEDVCERNLLLEGLK
jgi:hypothetical protein